MHSKSNNIETMIFDETHEAIEERFESLLKSYQIGMSRVYRLLKGYQIQWEVSFSSLIALICWIKNVIEQI